MGIVVIGGLFFSLILTLFVIPAMYTFFSKENASEPAYHEAVADEAVVESDVAVAK
jgi:multidrug efflux pump